MTADGNIQWRSFTVSLLSGSLAEVMMNDRVPALLELYSMGPCARVFGIRLLTDVHDIVKKIDAAAGQVNAASSDGSDDVCIDAHIGRVGADGVAVSGVAAVPNDVVMHLNEMPRVAAAAVDTDTPLAPAIDHIVMNIHRPENITRGNDTGARPMTIGNLTNAADAMVVMDVNVRAVANV